MLLDIKLVQDLFGTNQERIRLGSTEKRPDRKIPNSYESILH
jgi:hypothetical protein